MSTESNSSFVIMTNPKGEILLNRDARKHEHGVGRLNFNGGGVGMGELPIDAGVRETYEESGRVIFREALKFVGAYTMRKAYGLVFLYSHMMPVEEAHPPHVCDEVTEKHWILPEKVIQLPDTEIYPAQRTLTRYYLQWLRDGEKPSTDVGFLSPPFETRGKYFDGL